MWYTLILARIGEMHVEYIASIVHSLRALM